MDPKLVIIGFIIIEISLVLGIISIIYITTGKNKIRKQRKKLKRLQKLNRSNLEQIQNIESQTDLKEEKETSKDIGYNIKELVSQTTLIKDDKIYGDIAKRIEKCKGTIKEKHEILKKKEETQQSKWNTISELENRTDKITDRMLRLEDNFEMIEEQKIIVDIQNAIISAKEVLNNRSTKECLEKIDEINENIEKCQRSIEEKEEIKKSIPNWEKRIRILFNGWDKIEPEMLQEIPTEYRKSAIKRYYKKHKDEPIILQDNTICSIKIEWDQYRAIGAKYPNIKESIQKLEKDFNMIEEKKIAVKIENSLYSLEKALTHKNLDDFDKTKERTQKDIEECLLLISEKNVVNDAWPEWESRIKTLLDGWGKANYHMLPEIPIKWGELAFKRYYEAHKMEPIIYKENEIIAPITETIEPKDRKKQVIETSKKLTQMEARFYKYIASTGGEYSRSGAASELGLNMGEILKLEESLREKDYIE